MTIMGENTSASLPWYHIPEIPLPSREMEARDSGVYDHCLVLNSSLSLFNI